MIAEFPDLTEHVGTGKKFIVAYGQYGIEAEVHIVDMRVGTVCFGYRDQSHVWISKKMVRTLRAVE